MKTKIRIEKMFLSLMVLAIICLESPLASAMVVRNEIFFDASSGSGRRVDPDDEGHPLETQDEWIELLRSGGRQVDVPMKHSSDELNDRPNLKPSKGIGKKLSKIT